jgi:hypothetical protein
VLQETSLAPGETVRVHGDVRAPSTAGRWALVIDLVDDVDGSFAALGSAPAVVIYRVLGAGPGEEPALLVD